MTDKGKSDTSAPTVNTGELPTRFNSLMSIWYGLVFGSFTLYLIVQNVRRFVYFAEFPWGGNQKTPSDELNIYIGLIGGAVLLLPFFLTACILKIGNSANDNRQLGKHLSTRDEWSSNLVPEMLYQGNQGFWRTIWTHSGPTSSLIHVVSSFVLLLPQTLMEAVLIRHKFLPQDSIWKTDLDIILSHAGRNSILETFGEASEIKPALEEGFFLPFHHSTGIMSPEFFNFAVALVIYSVRYAQVFWHCSKSFTVLFSCQLVLNSFHAIVSYCNLCLLYKIHVFGPVEVLHKNLPFLLNNQVTLLLYGISSLILLASSCVLYHYGFLKISSFVKKQLKSQYICVMGDSSRLGWTFFPHCSALAVVLALAATQCPLVHDATLVYQQTLDNCALLFVISSAAHFLIWIILWLSFTAKHTWEFNLNVNIGQVHIRGLETLRLVAEAAFGDSQVRNPLTASMMIVNDGHAFAIADIGIKRSIMESLLQNAHIDKPEGLQERSYWAKPCLKSSIRTNPMDEEENSLIAHERKEYIGAPCRNKVAFSDELPTSRRFSRTAESIYSSRNYGSPNVCGEMDEGEGEYAILKKCGKTTLMKHLLTSTVDFNEENHQLERPNKCSTPDSGYAGKASSTASSTASPSDRTVNSDASSGIHGPIYGTKEQYPSAEYTTYDRVYCPIQSIYETRANVCKKSPRNSLYEASPAGKNLISPIGKNCNATAAASSTPSPYGFLPTGRVSSNSNEIPRLDPKSVTFQSTSSSASPYGILTSGRNPNVDNEISSASALNRTSSFRNPNAVGYTPRQSNSVTAASPMFGNVNSGNHYVDHPLPPIPPPLPPLSLLSTASMPNKHINNVQAQVLNSDGLRRSSSFRNPSRLSNHPPGKVSISALH